MKASQKVLRLLRVLEPKALGRRLAFFVPSRMILLFRLLCPPCLRLLKLLLLHGIRDKPKDLPDLHEI